MALCKQSIRGIDDKHYFRLLYCESFEVSNVMSTGTIGAINGQINVEDAIDAVRKAEQRFKNGHIDIKKVIVSSHYGGHTLINFHHNGKPFVLHQWRDGSALNEV